MIFSRHFLANPVNTAASKTAASGVRDFAEGFGRDNPVRRPLRGIVLRENTYASITVASAGQTSDRLYSSSVVPGAEDGGVGRTSTTTDLIIQSISIQRSEKFQAVPTFGAGYGFFFGEQHFFLNVQAILLDTEDFPWKRDWWANYEGALRGTRLAENRERAVLVVNGTMVEGYIINASTSENAAEEGYCQLSFTVWVTNIIYEGTAGSGRLSYGGRHTTNLSDSEIAEQLPVLPAHTQGVGDPAAPAATGLAGALQRIRNTFQSVRSRLQELTDKAEDFLLGRDIVIPPAGYSDVETVLSPEEVRQVRSWVATTRAPYAWGKAAQQAASSASGYTWENWDEYIQGFSPTGDYARMVGSEVQWSDARLALEPGSPPGWLGASVREVLQDRALAKISSEMVNLEPRWQVDTGFRKSEVTLRLGRSLYAAMSLASSFSRADEVEQRIFGLYTTTDATVRSPDAPEIRTTPNSGTPLPRGSGGVVWPEGT